MASNDTLFEPLLPKRRDLPSSLVGTELMIHDPETRKVHFLNSTAAAVWERCDGKTSIPECAEHLKRLFAMPADTDVLEDINDAVEDLRRRGLLDD